jgi:hypothetical protein
MQCNIYLQLPEHQSETVRNQTFLYKEIQYYPDKKIKSIKELDIYSVTSELHYKISEFDTLQRKTREYSFPQEHFNALYFYAEKSYLDKIMLYSNGDTATVIFEYDELLSLTGVHSSGETKFLNTGFYLQDFDVYNNCKYAYNYDENDKPIFRTHNCFDPYIENRNYIRTIEFYNRNGVIDSLVLIDIWERPAHLTTFQYDSRNNLIEELDFTYTWQNGDRVPELNYSKSFEFDKHGNIKLYTYQSNGEVIAQIRHDYNYDKCGNTQRIKVFGNEYSKDLLLNKIFEFEYKYK